MPTKPVASVNGFVLTRGWSETSLGLELVFWIASDSGPLRVCVSGQEAVCFYPAALQDGLESRLRATPGWRSAPTELKSFSRQPVAALYCRSQRQLYDLRQRLAADEIFLFESDIKPPDRFLMERFITGGVCVSGALEPADGFHSVLNPRLSAADWRPRLRSVSLDIETDFAAEALYSVALYGTGLAVVLMVGPTQSKPGDDPQAGVELQYYRDEKSLLLALLALLWRLDPDVLMGWNVVNFDLRCLQKFADRCGVELALGRNRECIQWRQARDGSDRFYAQIPGRVALDGIELMRNATYQFENFSLEYVAQQLLQRGKLIEDVDQRGEHITRLFHTDKVALAHYNLEDCRLVWDIFARERLVEFAVERSLLTGLELDRYGGSVAALDFLYLPRLHRQGYVAPAMEQLQADNLSPGGYVLPSQPGIFDNVIVLDFKSLYPSIIRTFHVDPLALVEGLNEADAIPGFDGGCFSRHRFILPQLIETLWTARDQAKRDNNAVLSQAIKIIMNSFYGVFGTRGCRFFDSRLVSSITRRGHDIIINSKRVIEEQGYQVIYGDTDSVFVLLGAMDVPEARRIGRQLAASLNQWWQQTIEQDFQLPSFLEIEFETHYLKFLMPRVRGSEAGSKKRYAGLVEDGQVLFKGLETVRSDWSPLAREFQQVLYRKIFLGEPYQDYVKQLVSKLLEGKFEAELVLRKRLRRKLGDYVKNVPPHVQAARKADSIRQQRQLPPLYQQGGWIEYLMTVNGPEPRQYRNSAIDFDFYIDKQLAPIADSILVFRSSSMEQILNRQIGLF